MFKLDLEKAEEPEINLPISIGLSKKQESSRKTSTSALLTTPKSLTVWITTNCGKFLKRWDYQTTLPASWGICMQIKKQQLELDMEQQTGPNQERSMSKLYSVTLRVFNFFAEYIVLNARLDEHKLESRWLTLTLTLTLISISRNINNLRYADDTTLMAESKEELKEPLDESERREWKSWLKNQHSEN